MTKKIIIAPIIVCLFVAIANIAFGQIFDSILWLIATFIFSVTLLPIIMNMKDQTAPIFQLFSTLIFLCVFFTIAAFLDFRQAEFPFERSLLYGLGMGLGTIAILILIKRK